MSEYKIDDVSEQQLKLGYWLATHQEHLKKALKIGLIALAGFFWAWTLFGLTFYLINLKQDSRIVSGLLNNQLDFTGFRERNQPRDLIIGSPQAIYTGKGKYDFIATAENPNRRGVTELAYQFAAADYLTATASMVILPGQKVYLTSLANAFKGNLSGADLKLKILNLKWQILKSRVELGTDLFAIEDVTYGLAEDGSRFRVVFKATNQTLQNFWQATFQAALYGAQGNFAGFNQITAERFLSGEERNLEISWFEKLPRVEAVEIIPVVDVYQSASFFNIPGQAGELN